MSNIFEKRSELEKLKQKIRDISLEIECAEKRCQHNWTINSYEETYHTGSIELSPIVILSDGTSITEKRRYETAIRNSYTKGLDKNLYQMRETRRN